MTLVNFKGKLNVKYNNKLSIQNFNPVCFENKLFAMSVVLIGRLDSDYSDVRSSHPIRHHQFWCKRGSWEEPRGRYESLGFKHLDGYVNLNVFCSVFEIGRNIVRLFLGSCFFNGLFMRCHAQCCVWEHSARPVFLLALAPLAYIYEPFEPEHLRIWQTR